MKRIMLFLFCISIIILNAGCQTNKTRTAEGAVIGGILGATAGGVIGHQSHHGGEGAGIGAAAGALAGAIIGSQIEKPIQTSQAAPSGQSINPSQMSIQDIVDLAKQGVHEDVIIDRIRLTNSKFQLTAGDIDYLRQQGITQKVIDIMQAGI